MSGELRLKVIDPGRGLVDLVGDPAVLPASGGGLLGVCRSRDEHWLTGAGQWQPGRPQWFPFARETPRPGTTVLEVAAVPLLDLFAAPPSEALSARLRFPARAGQDAQELDLELILPGATRPAAAPASPAPSAGDRPPRLVEPATVAAPPSSQPTETGAGRAEASANDAALAPGMGKSGSMRPELGQFAAAAGASDAPHLSEVAGVEGSADTLGDGLERPTVPRGKAVAPAGPRGNSPEVLPGGTVERFPVVAIERVSSWVPGLDGPGYVSAVGDPAVVPQGAARGPNAGRWPRIALAAIAAALLLALVLWRWWPDGGAQGQGDGGRKVRDRAYVADVLAGNPPAAALYREAEDADAEAQCDAALLLYREAAKGEASLAGRLGGKYDPEGFVPSPCIKEPSGSSAAAWYERAAEAGDALAQRRLGELMLDEGAEGVVRRKAIDWLRKAAASGDAAAARRLQEIGGG